MTGSVAQSIRWLLVLVLLAGTAFAQPDSTLKIAPLAKGAEPADPPEGFTWQKLDKINAYFLRPDGWFLRVDTSQGAAAYFITLEDFETLGGFRVGLSLSAKKRPMDTTVIPVFELCRNMIGERLAQHEVATTWEAEAGPTLQGHGCLARVPIAGGMAVVVYLAMGSSKTNTLYLMSFEAPEEVWNQYEGLGRSMLTLFHLDEDY